MLVLGHRGASATFPENTVPAFRAALDLGADGVELDVRRTGDGALAICHDAHLPDGRPIVETPATELPADVPDLEAALDACKDATVVNVEIKNWPDDVDFDPTEQLADQVVALLEERGELADGRILVTSFHLPTVDRVHALAPALDTGWLLIDPGDPAAVVEQVTRHGHRAIHPHHAFVNAELVEAAHAAELAVNAWTVDDPDRIRWLAGIGIDAVIVNDPAAALAALGR